MSNPSQVLILGEDVAHVGSVYRAVTDHLGVGWRRVRKLPLAAGKGDAKAYVLKRLECEAHVETNRHVEHLSPKFENERAPASG